MRRDSDAGDGGKDAVALVGVADQVSGHVGEVISLAAGIGAQQPEGSRRSATINSGFPSVLKPIRWLDRRKRHRPDPSTLRHSAVTSSENTSDIPPPTDNDRG